MKRALLGLLALSLGFLPMNYACSSEQEKNLPQSQEQERNFRPFKREGCKYSPRVLGGENFSLEVCDIDKDGKPDYIGGYIVLEQIFDGKTLIDRIERYPLLYWIDSPPRDGIPTREEFLIDPLRDGLNGNEKIPKEEIYF